MTDPTPVPPERSYGCSYACGNPYDFVIISVQDGTTEFLCVPCFVRLAADMVEAATNPESPDIQNMLRQAGTVDSAPMTTPNKRKRGHNAPVTNDDPDLLEAFDSVITEDELSEEFK